MFAEDMAIFYNTAEFARPLIRVRAGSANVPFNGIFSVVDQAAMQNFSITAQYQYLYATQSVDLTTGDVILDGAVSYKVREEPRRGNEGMDSEVLVG